MALMAYNINMTGKGKPPLSMLSKEKLWLNPAVRHWLMVKAVAHLTFLNVSLMSPDLWSHIMKQLMQNTILSLLTEGSMFSLKCYDSAVILLFMFFYYHPMSATGGGKDQKDIPRRNLFKLSRMMQTSTVMMI